MDGDAKAGTGYQERQITCVIESLALLDLTPAPINVVPLPDPLAPAIARAARELVQDCECTGPYAACCRDPPRECQSCAAMVVRPATGTRRCVCG